MIENTISDTTLQHYGVLGMQWGKRRGSTAVSTKRKAQLAKAKAKLKDEQAKGNIKKTKVNAKLEKSRVKKEVTDESLKVKGDLQKTKATKVATPASPKKSISDMSDTELRNRIGRIQMEKQFSELTAAKKTAGRKFVEQIMVDATRQALTTQTAKLMNNTIGGVLGTSGKGDGKDKGKDKDKDKDKGKTKTKKTKAQQGKPEKAHVEPTPKSKKAATDKGKSFVDDVIDVEFYEVNKSKPKDSFALTPYDWSKG